MKIDPGFTSHAQLVRQVAESILRHDIEWIDREDVSIPIVRRLFEAADILANGEDGCE